MRRILVLLSMALHFSVQGLSQVLFSSVSCLFLFVRLEVLMFSVGAYRFFICFIGFYGDVVMLVALEIVCKALHYVKSELWGIVS